MHARNKTPQALQLHEECLEGFTVLKMFGPKHFWEFVMVKPDGYGDSSLEPTELAYELNTTWGDMFSSRFNVVKKNCK